jgi:hypothetical protein
MKYTAVALTLTTFLLAGTPVLGKPKPSAPPTYLPSVVMPYDAYAPIFVAPMPEPRKNTGAANPYTPDPTRNIPGAEAKS